MPKVATKMVALPLHRLSNGLDAVVLFVAEMTVVVTCRHCRQNQGAAASRPPFTKSAAWKPPLPAFWHYACSKPGMLSLVFLGLAIVCALISRVLLLIAAIDITVWWAMGVFLPFGPLFFRLNYPEQARNSYLFRVATLLCIFAFVVLRPGLSLSMHNDHHTASFPQRPSQPLGYAMEKAVASKKANTASPVTPSVEQRRTANATELERVRGIEEQLRVRKRDILRSDTEGNRLYAIDLASYNEALAKATAEKNALASAK